MNTPQIFITCIGSYNAGYLHGQWVDADNIDTIHDAIEELKETAPIEESEEFFISDYDGFQYFEVTEYHDLNEVATVAKFITHSSADEWNGFLYLFDVIGYSVEDAIEKADEVCFYYGTATEYAEDFISEFCDLPDWATYYFDYEKFGYNLVLDGAIYEVEHEDDLLITNPQDF